METTLILFKPDAIDKGVVGTVLARFEANGFQVKGMKMLPLTPELLNEHYGHISDRPFFPKLAEFMTSTPVIALALAGENVINTVRDLIGATDSTKADKRSIRGAMGTNSMYNICHASDSPEAAEVELKRFFKEEELFLQPFEVPCHEAPVAE